MQTVWIAAGIVLILILVFLMVFYLMGTFLLVGINLLCQSEENCEKEGSSGL